MSVKYTGYEPTLRDPRAVEPRPRDTRSTEGFTALNDFSYGSQNWTMIDRQAATSAGRRTRWCRCARPRRTRGIPIDQPRRARAVLRAARRRHRRVGGPDVVRATSARDRPAVDGTLPAEQQPPAKGMYATANADPVGATFDGDPLNQPVVDGRPLYAGVTYAAGVREERITTVLDANKGAVTLDLMESLQHDTHSNVGAKLVPAILVALAARTRRARVIRPISPRTSRACRRPTTHGSMRARHAPARVDVRHADRLPAPRDRDLQRLDALLHRALAEGRIRRDQLRRVATRRQLPRPHHLRDADLAAHVRAEPRPRTSRSCATGSRRRRRTTAAPR